MTRRSRHRAGQPVAVTARAIIAVLVVAAVVVAPPLLLAALVGNPLPHQLPTGHVINGWLRAPISDQAALDVIAVLAWAMWLHLCGCLVTEFTRQLRGTSWHVPCGGINQRLAQHLVAAVLITGQSVAVGAATAATMLTPAPATHTTATIAPERRSPLAAQEPHLRLSAANFPLTAEHDYANRTIPTAGEVSAAGGHHRPIYREYVVAPPEGQYHDNLWDIAKRHLGDPLRWKEIFALNDGQLMTNGQRMTRASLIQPGWVLRMPVDATGLHDLPTPAAHPNGSSKAPDQPRTTPPSPTHFGRPGSSAASAEPRPDRPTKETPRAGNRPRELSSPAKQSSHSNPAVPIGAGLSIGALGLLVALERRRRVAARRRPIGTRLARPDPPLIAAEIRIRHDARDASVVAATVRLAVALAASRDPQINIRAAWHHLDGTVELLLDTARTPPEPFTGDGLSWRLAPAEQGFLFAVGESTDPVPVLIPVGAADGAVCYVNLEVPGLVGLDGPRPDVDAVIAGMVRALAAAPWAEELTQLVVPGRMQRAVIGLDRVEMFDNPAADLEHLTGYAEQVTADLTGQTTLAEARRSGEADTVRVVVLAGLRATEIPNQLLEAAMKPSAPILALLSGSHDNAQTWTLAEGRLTIPGIAETLDPLRVDSDEIDLTEALLTQARDAAPVPLDDPIYAEQAKDCPPQPEARQIEVRVLGPVEIAGADRVRRTPVLGLIVYLALHRRPVDSEQLFAALWPDREHNGHMLRTRMGEARTLLNGGIDHEGQRWVLANSIGCDWQLFQALANGDHANQLAALDLVRGRPFHGYDADWLHVDGYIQTVEAAIVDLALAVAEHALTVEDPVTATAAATAGLRACPYDERLYQIAMSAAAARGATGEVKALRRQLDRAMEDDIEPDDHIQPETVEVYEQSIRMNQTAAG